MHLCGNRGAASIIGAVFAILMLGLFGAVLVALVAMNQESRWLSVGRERAFYASQAGFEYALRQIDQGGYPIVQNKSLDSALFSISIDPSSHNITSVGQSADVTKTYVIKAPKLASDCAYIDASSATAGGASKDELTGLVLKKTCLTAVNVVSMQFDLDPDMGERVLEVDMARKTVFHDSDGVPSGQTVDIDDTVCSADTSIDSVEFSSSISGKQITARFDFSDSSYTTATFSLP